MPARGEAFERDELVDSVLMDSHTTDRKTARDSRVRNFRPERRQDLPLDGKASSSLSGRSAAAAWRVV